MFLAIIVFCIILIVAFAAGCIPVLGTVASFATVILSDLYGWEPLTTFLVLASILAGSIVGFLFGTATRLTSGGVFWVWSSGCFGNITTVVWHAGNLALDVFSATVMATSVLGLGVIWYRKKNKSQSEKCVRIFGRKICIGRDELEPFRRETQRNKE